MENINIKRIYALIIDSTLSNLIGVLVLSILNFDDMIRIGEFNVVGLKVNYGYSLQIWIFLVYFLFFDVTNKGVTLGKLMFSIIVVNKLRMTKLTFKESLKRTFYKIIGILILPITAILFLKRQGFTIQDKFCNTTTIKTNL